MCGQPWTAGQARAADLTHSRSRSGPAPDPADTAPILIALDGYSGVGKTTLAAELAAALGTDHSVSVFHLEDIYPGWDGLAAGQDYFSTRVAPPLAAGRTAHWQAWDWTADRYGPWRSTEPAEIIIFEGVGSSCAAVRPLLDASVWVQAPAGLRREQALARDGDTYAPHWDRWAAQEQAWTAADPAAAEADILVEAGRGDRPDVLTAYLLRALHERLPRLRTSGQAQPALQVQRLDAWHPPETVFAALFADSPRSVWLDSSSSGESGEAADSGDAAGAGHIAARSRFSIMADDGGPAGRFAEHSRGLTTVTGGPVTQLVRGPFFKWLDSAWGLPQVPAPAGYPGGFTLGWLGYLGYELKRESGATDVQEQGQRQGHSPAAGPEAALLFAGRALVLDHRERCVFLLTLTDPWLAKLETGAEPDAGAGPGPTTETGAAWTARVRRTLRNPTTAETGGTAEAGGTGEPWGTAPVFTVRDSRLDYLMKVKTAQQEIAAGNSYEICLTTRLQARLDRTLDAASVLALYLALRRRSPAPFASLLRFGAFSLAGTSPERFLSLDAAGGLRAEPIKGTRPRGRTVQQDRALAVDLRTSAKDRAENIMIVDLLRNDLSRSAVPGSVTVPRLCAVETYATVHQLVSTVDATLRPGASRAGAVAAAFPPGSMTGAPKISTMNILDQLEGGPRGAYSGVVGWFSLSGAADLSVVIRTLEITTPAAGPADPLPGQADPPAGSVLGLGVGGAVTADSDPAAEWEEVRAKAYGVLSALGSVFPD